MKSLDIGAKRWYAAVASLEDLGLVVGVRALGGKKIRYFTITREGREAMTALSSIGLLISDSKAVLRREWAMVGRGENRNRKCEILCMLLLHAEREAKRDEIRRVIQLAEAGGHREEAMLGAAMLSSMAGDDGEAIAHADAALEEMDRGERCAADLRILRVRAESLSHLKQVRAAAGAWHDLRKAAKRRMDIPMVVEAYLGLGNLLLVQGLVSDAAKEYEKGLVAARRGHLAYAEANVLWRMAVAEYIQNADRGLARLDEALDASLSSGAVLTQAKVKADRALMIAARGDGKGARKLLREARGLFEKMGDEHLEPSMQNRKLTVDALLESHKGGHSESGRMLASRAITEPNSEPRTGPSLLRMGEA